MADERLLNTSSSTLSSVTGNSVKHRKVPLFPSQTLKSAEMYFSNEGLEFPYTCKDVFFSCVYLSGLSPVHSDYQTCYRGMLTLLDNYVQIIGRSKLFVQETYMYLLIEESLYNLY
jgi:hypothetical protein